MKTDKLEELYREKFSGLDIEPSERAKVLFKEKLITKKRKLWVKRLSIAASLLLIAVTTTLLFMPAHDSIKISDRSNIEEGIIRSEGDSEKLENDLIEGIRLTEKTDGRSILPSEKKMGEDLTEIVKVSPDFKTKTMDLDEPELSIAENVKEKDIEEAVSEDQAVTSDPAVESENMAEALASVENESDNSPPVKITIEYIAGNTQSPISKERKEVMKKFYSNVNNLLYPDEVLGDIRSLKDQLFALDFENENKSETQNKNDK